MLQIENENTLALQSKSLPRTQAARFETKRDCERKRKYEKKLQSLVFFFFFLLSSKNDEEGRREIDCSTYSCLHDPVRLEARFTYYSSSGFPFAFIKMSGADGSGPAFGTRF